jgi:hypothetical protein
VAKKKVFKHFRLGRLGTRQMPEAEAASVKFFGICDAENFFFLTKFNGKN